MPELNDDDLLVVGRDDTSYTVEVSSVMSDLQDTDLLVVGRDDTSYSIKFEDFKSQVGGGGGPGGGIYPGINDITISPPVSGSGTLNDPFILTPRIAAPAGSTATSSETITFVDQGKNTDVIWTDNSVDAGTRFSQPVTSTDSDGTWSGQLQYADTPDSLEDTSYTGLLQIGLLYFSWQVNQSLNDRIPTEVVSVNLVDTGEEVGPRFTDQTFAFTSTVDDGAPLSTKTIEAHVDGSIRIAPESSEIVGVTQGGTIGEQYTGGTTTVGNTGVTSGNWDYVFTNDAAQQNLNITVSASGGSTFPFTEYVLPKRFSMKQSIEVWFQQSQTGSYMHLKNTEGGSRQIDFTTQQNYIKVTQAFTTEVDSIRIYAAGSLANPSITIIKMMIDGVPYETPLDVLTLADDTGLSSFSTGDAVQQDSAFGAVTSEIVDVDTTTIDNTPYLDGAVTLAGSGQYVSNMNFWNLLFEGDSNQSVKVNMTNPAGNVIADYMFAAPVDVSSFQFSANTTGNTAELILYSEAGGTDGDITFDTVREIRSIDVTNGPITGFRVQQKGGQAENVALCWVGFDNKEWDDEDTILTLADNKDLDKFVAGDLVQQDAPVVTSDVSVFSTTLYTGNDSTQTITNGIDLAGQGGMVWVKAQNDGYSPNYKDHAIVDTVRGDKVLSSNTTEADNYWGDPSGFFPAFNSDGFTVGAGSGMANNSTRNYASWTFLKASGFFDIQTYTGTDGAPRVLPHSLQATPGFIIIKSYSVGGTQWYMYHKELGLAGRLDFTNAAAADSPGSWQDITSTTFGVGTSANLNAAGREHVAYLFADTPGLIKCGSYIGAGEAQVEIGFEPEFVIIKNTTNTGDWYMFSHIDNSGYPKFVLANTNAGKGAGTKIEFNPTGFVPITNNEIAQAGDKYIYIAIAKDAMADTTLTPSGLFQSTDGNTITLTPQTDGWQANQGTKALGPTTTASGTVSSIDGSTMTVDGTVGTWTPNEGKYVVGPEKITANARQYLKFDSSGNVTDMQSRPQDPPYTTTSTNPSLNLTFPSTFPSGETPDDELPEGTTLSVGIASENIVNRSPASGYEEAIVQPKSPIEVSDVFSVTKYIGNGSVQKIINGIDLAGKGGLVWIKNRDIGYDHALGDTVRSPNWLLASQNDTGSTFIDRSITNFNNDGFDINTQVYVNNASSKIISWTFRNKTGFFDIQVWTGTGSTGQVIPHNLGTPPACIIGKRTDGSADWYVYHKDLGFDKALELNTTNAAADRNPIKATTDTTFTTFGELDNTNDSFVGYLFADTPGLIKCGSYQSTSSTISVDVGFEPQWVMIKNTNDSADWVIFDTKRGSESLMANTSGSEAGFGGAWVWEDFGFTINISSNLLNDGSSTYVYVAIAAPIPPTSNDIFDTTLYVGNNANRTFTNGIDLSTKGLVWLKSRTSAQNNELYDAVRAPTKRLISNLNSGENVEPEAVTRFNTDGFDLGTSGNVNGSNEYVAWSFKAAPKFFDIQTYTGNGISQNVPHDLGSTPGFMVIKKFTGDNWHTYHQEVGATDFMILNESEPAENRPTVWSTDPTSTYFTVGSDGGVNGTSLDFLAYLFADTPGLIKCSSYTGTGTAQQVNVGFAPQWLLVKNATGGGNWCVVDNKRRGSGLDYVLFPDISNAEATSDLIQLTSTGFTVKGGSGLVGNSGSKYIYVAIAAPAVDTMTAEQFAESQAKFSTYDLRSDLYEGEQAKDKIEELTKRGIDPYEYFDQK